MAENTTTLKIEKNIIENINNALKQKAGASWKIDAKTMAIKINKAGVEKLQQAGINIENGYISRKNSAYNIMLDLLKNNADIFAYIEQ